LKQLTESQKREVRMYGVTEVELRESVERSITFRTAGPAMMVAGLMSDSQEMVSYGPHDNLANILEDQRLTLNRAKFILFTYIMDRETA